MTSGRATEAYRSHLADLPQAADYAPSKWRRLGAALSAGAASLAGNPKAMELGEGMRDAPFKGALTNWQLKGAGLKEQADMEATDQKGRYEMVKQYRDYLDKKADNERADLLAKSTIEANDARIANYQNQGWTKDYSPTGTILMIKGNQIVDTGIPSAKTTDIQNDATRIGQGQQGIDISRGHLGVAQGQLGVAQGNLANSINQTGIAGFNAQTGRMNAITGQVESGARIAGAGNNQMSADQIYKAQALATQEVLASNPEWKGWVKEDGTVKGPNDYTWSSPPTDATPGYTAFKTAVANAQQKYLGMRPPGSYVPQYQTPGLPPVGPPDGATLNPRNYSFGSLPR